MHTFLLMLHVLAAVFLTGPLVIAPMTGLRALRRGNAHAVRESVRQTTLYAGLSLLVFALGAAVVPTKPDEYTFSTPWVIIAMTLYIIAALLVGLVVVPALNSAANLLTPEEAVEPAEDVDSSTTRDDAAKSSDSATSSDSAASVAEARAKLDALRGRIAASSGTVAALLLVTTALMVVRPFGH